MENALQCFACFDRDSHYPLRVYNPDKISCEDAFGSVLDGRQHVPHPDLLRQEI